MKNDNYFNRYFFYDLTKVAWYIPFMIVFRPKCFFVSEKAKEEYQKISKTGSAIVTSNHQEIYDPILMNLPFRFRRRHIISARETVNGKVLNWLCRKMLSIPINRDKLELSEFKEIMGRLKHNKLVFFFIEGHMNKNEGTLDEFKDGPAIFALKANVPVFPIYYIKRKSIFERQKYAIGEPVYVYEEGYTMDNIKEATNKIRQNTIDAMNLAFKIKKV